MSIAPAPAQWRDQLPVTRNLVYLDHASMGPLPRPTVTAMVASIEAQAERGSLEHARLHAEADAAKADYAALIGAQPAQIAHITNTASGMGIIAAGLDWRAGDEVVVLAMDFPSVVLPWMTLQPRGVTVRRVPDVEGQVSVDAILAACGPRTRVVCASWVQFSNGARLDLARLGQACRERGILFVVDGVQGVGVLQIDVAALPIDALVVHAYKWLLAPQGVGWLYVADTLAPRLTLPGAGPRSMKPGTSFLNLRFDPRPDAGRFETGLLNFHGIVAARASMGVLQSVGAGVIEARARALAARLAEGLVRLGCEVQGGATRAGFESAIVAFRHPRRDAVQCQENLLQAGIVTRAREGWVRVAPHFYNDADEVDALLARLAAL